MQHYPDSALQKLMSFNTDSCFAKISSFDGEISSVFNENYRHILLSEAYYKTNHQQYNYAELQDAMHYFDSLAENYINDDEIIMLSARAHYMSGVRAYENDSVVIACKEYLKTLEIMQNSFDETALVGYKAKFMGLLYTRLGSLMFYHGSEKESTDLYKKALEYFSKLPNYSLVNSYKSIASSFHIYNNDSAFYYYKKAKHIAKKENKLRLYGQILAEAAPLYYDLGYKDSALIMIRESFLLPHDENQHLIRCCTYGQLLTNECQYDSAIYYLEKSLSLDRYATQAVAAENLIKCYQTLGDTTKMLHYKILYGERLNQYRSNIANIDKISHIYLSYKHNQEQKKYNSFIKKQNNKIVFYSSLFIVFVIGMVMLVRKHIVKFKKKSHNDMKEKDKALAEMKRKIESFPFKEEPICKYILEIASNHRFKSKVGFETYKEYALDKNQILALRDAVDRHYDNFPQKLNENYPELTYDDINYCCLYLLGLKDADISALMQRAYPTICERSRKLKRIFNSDDPMPITIKHIVDNQ